MTAPPFAGRAAPDEGARRATAAPPTRRRPILPVVLLALHLPLVAFAWTAWHTIATDGHGVLTDFGAWYSAGQIVRDHGGERLYDPELQQQLQFAEGDRLGETAKLRPFVNPPHVAALMVPFAALEGNRAFIAWNLLNLGLLATLGFVTARILRAEPLAWRVAAATAAAGAGCVTVALLEGSLSVLCAVGLVAFAAGVLTDRDGLVAVGLAVASVKPHFAVLPVVLLVAQGRWRMLAWSAVAGAATVAATLPLVGPQAWLRYPDALLHYGGPGADAPEFARFWWTVSGALASFGGEHVAGLISPVGWLTFAASVVAVAVLARRATGGGPTATVATLAIALVASIVLAAHANAQDAVVVVPVLALLRRAGLAGRARPATSVVGGIALLWPAAGVVAVLGRTSPLGTVGTGLLLAALVAMVVELRHLTSTSRPTPATPATPAIPAAPEAEAEPATGLTLPAR